MASDKYTIGLDYGTDSVRALIVNTTNGNELATSVFYYPRWKAGKFCNPGVNQFRQHPMDYLEGLEESIKQALSQVSEEVRQNIVGISIDTTGSTPVAVNKEGIPLSLKPEFSENPNAMFVLWKDHTAVVEADEINRISRSWGGVDFTCFEGGIYSSEWFWAKILHILRSDEKVRDAAYSWVEHCDWIPAVLTGNPDPKKLIRSRCAAGHKAMWHKDFGGLPSEEFLVKIDPLLRGLRDRLYTDTYECDYKVGEISHEWAVKLELPKNVSIGAGSFDAHLGAVGGEVQPYYLSKVMGTSTCDMLIAPMQEMQDKLVAGICGQVDGSIIPGMLGMEAGQSAFGDIYAWYKKLLLWPIQNSLNEIPDLSEKQKQAIFTQLSERLIDDLSEAASKVKPSLSAPLAVDWMNGRRTPDANQNLKGAITGITLGTDAPMLFRALVEATAFGARAINERFKREGVRIDGVIALGGVAKKSPFVMQIVCDVLNMPIKVARSEQTCALGSAMAASVVAGIYPDLAKAQAKMGGGFEKEYFPDTENARVYKAIYAKYFELGQFLERSSF
ncbi:MAG: ribulokinase [Bacteroidales bacterium]|nr:ribulokinase [Bacteroidales bacterium]MCB8999865.1 ribulokinase [Bacteroidales bacterium]